MPATAPPGFRLGAIKPADAVAAFKQRQLLLKSFRWQDVWQEEHTTGLAVAGVSRLDVLQVFKDELDAVVNEGRNLADFSARIQPQLAAKGFWGDVEVTDEATGKSRITRFDDRRLRLIFDVNLRQSHAAGRWARAQRSKGDLPYLVYVTMHDERVRLAHKAWDYLALPVDHEFWNTHLPPNGWMCRCHFFASDQAGLDALRAAGKKVQTDPPRVDWLTYVNPRTDELVPVPRGIDPGFAYNPGKARDAAFFDQMLRKAAASHPVAAAVAVAQATAQRGAFVAQATQVFEPWARGVVATGRVRGELRYIGALNAQAVRALTAAGFEPASAAIAVRDADVLHALRPSKAATAAGVAAEVYYRLPELLARASAVLVQLDARPPAVFYVIDQAAPEGAVAKLVVLVDMPVRMVVDPTKGVRRTVPLNLVRTITAIDAAALSDRTQYLLVWGRL